MNNALRLALVASLAVAVAAGCSKKVKEAPPEQAPVDNGATTGGIVDNTPGRYTPADLDTDQCLRTRVIYFDFDQDLLRPEFQATINCHAKYLRDRPESRMEHGSWVFGYRYLAGNFNNDNGDLDIALKGFQAGYAFSF